MPVNVTHWAFKGQNVPTQRFWRSREVLVQNKILMVAF